MSANVAIAIRNITSLDKRTGAAIEARLVSWPVCKLSSFNLGKTAKWNHLPTLRHRPNFRLFLRLPSCTFGEELVHECFFQFGRGLNNPLLRFNCLLHNRKNMRDLLLLRQWGDVKSEVSKICLIENRNCCFDGCLFKSLLIRVKAVVYEVWIVIRITDQRIDLLVSRGTIIADHAELSHIADTADENCILRESTTLLEPELC